MKIQIFTESALLADCLPAQKQGASISVLDFTGNARVRNAAGDRLLPSFSAAFSAQEKERIMDEYVEAVSALGDRNGFSLQWLCHPLSEKNDLVPGNLFEQLAGFLSFRRGLANCRGETLMIAATDPRLLANMTDYLAKKNIGFTVSGAVPGAGQAFSSLRRLYGLLKEGITVQRRFLASRFLWKRLDKSRTYAVIRTWFDHRSAALIARGEDVYFGRFPRFLEEHGHAVLYFGEFVEGFDHEFASLKGIFRNPVLPGRSLVHACDFIGAILFQCSLRRKLRLPQGLTVLDVDVDAVFHDYFQRHSWSPQVRRNYFSYLEAVKLVKKLKIDRFFMPFENYAWEKLTWTAISRFAPQIKVTAFQHAQVSLNAAKFFLGRAESRARLLPQRIVTLGEISRQFLVAKKNYPGEALIAGCALRHDRSIPAAPVARRRKRRILVQCWSLARSVKLVHFMHEAGLGLGTEGYRVTLNPHPGNPLAALLPRLDFEWEKEFMVAGGSLKENFDRNDLVVYHGTTTCLDALAAGLPVINVEFDDLITVDPLFAFDAFKWTVREPGELAGVIERIDALSDEEYFRRQRQGFDFVRRYFYPVTEANMEKFLWQS